MENNLESIASSIDCNSDIETKPKRVEVQDKKRFSVFPKVKKLDLDKRSRSLANTFAEDNDDHAIEPIDKTLKQVKIDGIEAFTTSTTKFGKLFWIIMILLASGVLIYEIYKTVDNYMNSPIVTMHTVKPMNEMDFPEIYICTSNFVKQSALNNNTLTNKFARFYKNSVSTNLYQTKCEDNDDANHDGNYAKSLNYTKSQIMGMGFLVEEVLYQCNFRQSSMVTINCNEYATPVLDPNYGKCFLLKINDKKQIISSQGLMLIMYLNKEEYPNDKCLTPDTTGAMISIGNPFNPADNQMLFIPPVTYTRIDMRAQHLSFIDVKGGQRCVESDTFEFSVLNVTYSQSACQRDCYLKSLVTICNCIPIIDPMYIREDIRDNTHFCTIEQTRKCIVSKVSNSKAVTDTVNSCSEQCYTACDSWRYPARISSFKLNGQVYEKYQIDVNNLMVVMISFADLEVEVFEQQLSKTVDDLVADIGGQINLWLGASMITLVQLPILIFTLCGWAIYGSCRK